MTFHFLLPLPMLLGKFVVIAVSSLDNVICEIRQWALLLKHLLIVFHGPGKWQLVTHAEARAQLIHSLHLAVASPRLVHLLLLPSPLHYDLLLLQLVLYFDLLRIDDALNLVERRANMHSLILFLCLAIQYIFRPRLIPISCLIRSIWICNLFVWIRQVRLPGTLGIFFRIDIEVEILVESLELNVECGKAECLLLASQSF